MAAQSEPWRKKMVVQNIPRDWSQDMLENFMEVVTKAELEDNGVEYFCDISHTALLTFTQPLTEEHVRSAESENHQKGKPLKFSLIRTAPASILIRDVSPTLTRDNLFYYFDSSRSGGVEGEAENCELLSELRMAVVVFSSPQVAAGVLSVTHHAPSKGSSVRAEPCYNEFHKLLFQDLKHSGEDTSPHHPQAAAPASPKPLVPPKPPAQVRPPILPKPHVNSSKQNPQSSDQSPQEVSDFPGCALGSRRQHANFQSYPRPSQRMELEEDRENMMYPPGGYRRGGKKHKYKGRGRGSSREEPHRQGGYGDEDRQRGRGRGRRPFNSRNRPSSAGRGRGRGEQMFASRAQEAVLTSFESEHESVGVGAAAWTPKAAVPHRVIKLDADCNPIPHDVTVSESAHHKAVPVSGQFNDDLNANCPDLSLDIDDIFVDTSGYKRTSSDEKEYDGYETAKDPLVTSLDLSGPLNSVVTNSAQCQGASNARLVQKTPSPSEKASEIEAERLKREKQNLEAELQKFKKENEELKNRRKWREEFPTYKLRLMGDFNTRCGLCKIEIHEKEGAVEFYGLQDDYEAAKCAFMMELQDLAEDSLSVSSEITAILQTELGKQYIEQLCQSYPSCSYDVQSSGVVCAAIRMTDVQDFLKELKRNVHHRKCKVNKNTMSQLHTMKAQLEKYFPLARIKLSSGGGDEVIIDGFNGDVELVLREVGQLSNKNQAGTLKLKVAGPLKTKACNRWCTQQLDDVKTLIIKNGGEVTPDDQGREGFTLTYQCRKDLFQQVQQKLDVIEKTLEIWIIDLKSEFKSYSEQVLVINGLHNMGIEPFCALVEEKLKAEEGWECIIRFNLPPKRNLPKLEYKPRKAQSSKPPRPRPRLSLQPKTRHSGHHRRRHGDSIRPFSATVGNGTLAVKSGDIASENVDCLVCVVGEDMDLNQTAVGQAIVKVYPQVAQTQPQGGPGQQAGRVVVVNIAGAGRQPASTLLLAVLTKWSQPNQSANVKTLVQNCLQRAVRQGSKSVAFPPLGVGRKFQFAEDLVANAMVTTAHQFLKSNPNTLQSVTFVIYDTNVARKFRETARRTHNPSPPSNLQFILSPQPADDSESDADDDSDGYDDGDDDGNGGISFQGSDDDRNNSGSNGSDGEDIDFNIDDDEDQTYHIMASAARQPRVASPNSCEAQLCLHNHQDRPSVKAGLLRQLRSMFICEDHVDDMKTFKKLATRTVEEIKSAALRRDVVLSVQIRGGKEMLVVRGHRVGVTEMMALIKDRLHAYINHAQKEEGRQRRHRSGGLPFSADRVKLPSYWKICRDGIFKDLQQFFRDHSKYGKLYSVDGPEFTEVDSLIKKTWDVRFVGHGRDAANLRHKSIQVSKVERLENPNLWEVYCTHRERLIRRVQQEQRGKAFIPMEKVKGSSGGVKTTMNLSRHNLLSRETFPQVNEHYLFHGTKKEYIEPIINSGLDTRIASDNSMLGRGVYASESATKADQYTDDKTKRTSGNKTMILMRVLLGEPYINKAHNPTKYSRPPCKTCYKDRCQCKNVSLFDSVIDDAGRNFREFVVYDQCMCYPEYFITYQRV